MSSRRVAQPGSALAWGARGREFESRHADHLYRINGLHLTRCNPFFFSGLGLVLSGRLPPTIYRPPVDALSDKRAPASVFCSSTPLLWSSCTKARQGPALTQSSEMPCNKRMGAWTSLTRDEKISRREFDGCTVRIKAHTCRILSLLDALQLLLQQAAQLHDANV